MTDMIVVILIYFCVTITDGFENGFRLNNAFSKSFNRILPKEWSFILPFDDSFELFAENSKYHNQRQEDDLIESDYVGANMNPEGFHRSTTKKQLRSEKGIIGKRSP